MADISQPRTASTVLATPALEKLKKLLALVSLAHGLYLVAGCHIDRKMKRIGHKKNGYKGQSYFRRVKDVLEAYLTGKPLDVVVDWDEVFISAPTMAMVSDGLFFVHN